MIPFGPPSTSKSFKKQFTCQEWEFESSDALILDSSPNFLDAFSSESFPGRRPARVSSFTGFGPPARNPACVASATTATTLTSSQNLFKPRLKILFSFRPQPQSLHRQRLLNPPYPAKKRLDIFPRLFLIQQ